MQDSQVLNNGIDGYVYKAHKWQCLLKINVIAHYYPSLQQPPPQNRLEKKQIQY